MGSLIWMGKSPVTTKGGALVVFFATQCKLLNLSLVATRTEGVVLTAERKKGRKERKTLQETIIESTIIGGKTGCF